MTNLLAAPQSVKLGLDHPGVSRNPEIVVAIEANGVRAGRATMCDEFPAPFLFPTRLKFSGDPVPQFDRKARLAGGCGAGVQQLP